MQIAGDVCIALCCCFLRPPRVMDAADLLRRHAIYMIVILFVVHTPQH